MANIYLFTDGKNKGVAEVLCSSNLENVYIISISEGSRTLSLFTDKAHNGNHYEIKLPIPFGYKAACEMDEDLRTKYCNNIIGILKYKNIIPKKLVTSDDIFVVDSVDYIGLAQTIQQLKPLKVIFSGFFFDYLNSLDYKTFKSFKKNLNQYDLVFYRTVEEKQFLKTNLSSNKGIFHFELQCSNEAEQIWNIPINNIYKILQIPQPETEGFLFMLIIDKYEYESFRKILQALKTNPYNIPQLVLICYGDMDYNVLFEYANEFCQRIIITRMLNSSSLNMWLRVSSLVIALTHRMFEEFVMSDIISSGVPLITNTKSIPKNILGSEGNNWASIIEYKKISKKNLHRTIIKMIEKKQVKNYNINRNSKANRQDIRNSLMRELQVQKITGITPN